MKPRPSLKSVIKGALIGLALLPLCLILFSTWWIKRAADPFVYHDIMQTPVNETGLVLGTGHYSYQGKVNPHFVQRIEAAARLYHAGRVKRLLLSGNEVRNGSHEASQMQFHLLRLHVPETALILDGQSFRTLDSVLRAPQILGQSRFTIVTEEYHSYRAVFLARFHRLDAVAYCPAELPWLESPRTRVREYLARVKALLDLYVLHTKAALSAQRLTKT